MTEIPTHYATILMPSQMKALKIVTEEDSTKQALAKAVEFALANMLKVKEK